MSNPTELPVKTWEDRMQDSGKRESEWLAVELMQAEIAEYRTLARRAQPEGKAPQAGESSEPLDVEFKKLADTILQATTNGTRLEALRGMAALFDKQAEQNATAPADTLSPLCGAQHAEGGALPAPVAYRYPKSGNDNGYYFDESLRGEEERFKHLWEPVFTESQLRAALAAQQAAPTPRIIGGQRWSKEAEMTEGWLAAQQAAAPAALALLSQCLDALRTAWNIAGYTPKKRAEVKAAIRAIEATLAQQAGNAPEIPDGPLINEGTSAPGTPEAPKKPAHGHRDDYYLLANGRRLGLEPITRVRNMPNWVLAMGLFATGSGSAYQICRDAGVDPESTTVERAAQLDGGQEGSGS